MKQSTKEWVLNYIANRWGLNKKRRLESTSDSIRICQPENKEIWIDYYYTNVKSQEEIDELGRLLYPSYMQRSSKGRTFSSDLLASISEDDCMLL